MSLYGNTVKTLTVTDIVAMKRRCEKISCVTVYDASFTAVCDEAGIDILLVGDSLGMVVQGHDSTLPVTIEDMIYHSRCVTRARKRAFIIADLPFMTYPTPLIAAQHAAQLMQQGVQMVKLEGARLDCVQFLVEQGIPVCGHLGLLPQQINHTGLYKIQGKTLKSAELLLEQAKQLQQAGASLLVLECIPASLAKTISQTISIPVIGIGAGLDCDGQVLVLYDMLGISLGKTPRFSKNFMQETDSIQNAILAYHQAVKQQQFPTLAHSF
ncbi:3-methyl-2-oxobutanoate hydroxymethyltransferase [Patescibacteria group bacterium]|nr:3-methyl-2-oxobutanoate hydroxymethyltransferase [Patescibacteria group bacterium]